MKTVVLEVRLLADTLADAAHAMETGRDEPTVHNRVRQPRVAVAGAHR